MFHLLIKDKTRQNLEAYCTHFLMHSNLEMIGLLFQQHGVNSCSERYGLNKKLGFMSSQMDLEVLWNNCVT